MDSPALIRRRCTAVTAPLLLATLTACADSPTSSVRLTVSQPQDAAASVSARPLETRRTSLDAALSEYAAAIPGFGGFALDTTAEQALVVSLVDGAQSARARAVLAPSLRGFSLGRGRSLADQPIKFRKVDYAFAQLVA